MLKEMSPSNAEPKVPILTRVSYDMNNNIVFFLRGMCLCDLCDLTLTVAYAEMILVRT